MQQQNLNLYDVIQGIENEMESLDGILGKGLTQPFNNTNSGSRKLMYSTHLEHSVMIKNAEIPIIQTGYEYQFGQYNSSIIKAQNDYEVYDIIPKFSFNERMVYYVILIDHTEKVVKMIKRSKYEYTTETFGYEYDTRLLDSLEKGFTVPKSTVIRKSKAYDDYMNRMDGCNLNSVYMNTDKNKQDSFIISEEAAIKLSTTNYHTTQCMFNDNDIPLNLYGDRTDYKSFPDIGEEVQSGLLCGIRRNKLEEAEYTQTFDMLSKILMSDEKITMNGIVYDIDIYCNNPDILRTSIHYKQLYKYYVEKAKLQNRIIELVDNIKLEYPEYSIDYSLDMFYYESMMIKNGSMYVKDKPFSNTVITFYTAEVTPITIGDKISNRYGGKGVVSYIFPKELMPFNPETGEYADVIVNSNGCTNRLNPGQMFELHTNSASRQIVNFIYKCIRESNYSSIECAEIIHRFLSIVAPKQAVYFKETIDNLNSSLKRQEELDFYIQSIIDDGYIKISIEPITESISIDILDRLYKEFPFIHDCKLIVPQLKSNGKYRLVETNRVVPFAPIYMLRLKQRSEEKFSSTSLSSTNLKGLNTKSKANKEYRTTHSKTPIQFGNMEIADMASIGMDYIVSILMIHSVSPRARRLLESALTGDPYNINISLTDDCANRNVEILNAYLKTMGVRLVFNKIPLISMEAVRSVYDSMSYDDHFKKSPVRHFKYSILSDEYIEKHEKEMEENKQKRKHMAVQGYAVIPHIKK